MDLRMSFPRMTSHIVSIRMNCLWEQMQDKPMELDEASCVPLMDGMDMGEENTRLEEEANREKEIRNLLETLLPQKAA